MAWLGDRSSLLPALQPYVENAPAQKLALDRVAQLVEQWPTFSISQVRGILLQIVKQVIVQEAQLDIEVRPARLLSVLDGKSGTTRINRGAQTAEESTITLSTAVRLQRCSYGMRMVIDAERSRKPDPRLVSLIVQAHAWKEKLLSGEHGGMEAIAREENVTASWVTRVLRLAFLAPDITRSILDGRQPVTLTSITLIRDTRLAMSWSEQKAQLGFN